MPDDPDGDKLIVNGNYIPLEKVGTHTPKEVSRMPVLLLKNQKKNVGNWKIMQSDRKLSRSE